MNLFRRSKYQMVPTGQTQQLTSQRLKPQQLKPPRLKSQQIKPQCLDKDDPINCMVFDDAKQMWGRFMPSRGTCIWIMYCNFFFGVLPAILFLSNSIYIASLESEEVVQTVPSIPGFDAKSIARWFAILFILFPIGVSVFQLCHFSRFIGVRLIWTFFIGQAVGMLWYGLAFSRNVSTGIGRLFRKKKVGSVFLIMTLITLAISSFVFLVYIQNPFFRSELYSQDWTYKPIF